MKLKRDGKFIRKLTRDLKYGITNLVNFHASSQKSENFHFDGLLLSKAYNVLDEKVQKSYVITLKNDPKFEIKTDTWSLK